MITQKKLRIKLVVFYQWTSGHLKKVSPEERSEISLKKPLKSHVAKRSSTMFNVVFAGPAGYYSKFFLFYILRPVRNINVFIGSLLQLSGEWLKFTTSLKHSQEKHFLHFWIVLITKTWCKKSQQPCMNECKIKFK